MYPEIFEKLMPGFLSKIDPYCAQGKFILGGDNMTIADFALGGLYTNYLNNPSMSFAKDKWAALLDQFPNFAAYGERYVAANEAYLSKRAPAPI